MNRLLLVFAALCVCLLSAAVQVGCSATSVSTTTGTGGEAVPASGTDADFARAFADQARGVELEGGGTVERLLSDDTDGARHQRFIVRLASGQTLLVAHNIDIAPRVDSLQVGDAVRFKGEYEWNAQGGVIHWTHHDPSGSHVAGWIEHDGRKYQ